jgi:tetratricopeptide (TPR) repeat protein
MPKDTPQYSARMVASLVLALAVQAGPVPLPDLLQRARQLLEASDRSGARRELAEALRLYPDSPVVYNFLGALEAGDGHYAEAERSFREAVRRAPTYTEAYLNLGRLYQQNAVKDPRAITKAIGAYEAILRNEPGHAEARFQSATLLQRLGEFSRSLAELEQLPAADQDRPTVLSVRLADHAGRGDRAEADAVADRLLDRPDLTEVDVRAVLPALGAHGRDDLALRLLEKLRDRGWATADDLQSAGLIQEKLGRFALAREALEQAAALRPQSVPFLLDLARVAYKAGDNTGALGYLAHARALEPENARVHFLFGMICVELDLGTEAYDSLKEAVRLDPENAAVNYAFGAVALHRKDPSEAIPYFRKYAALEPGEPRGPFAVGVAAYEARDYATAREKLVPAADNPDFAATANYLLARMDRAENTFDEALVYAQRAVDANPGYADAWAELGLIQLQRGQTAEAEKALDRCLALEPDHYLGNMQLALLYARTRDPRGEAQRQRFEQIKKRGVEKARDFLRPIEVRPY